MVLVVKLAIFKIVFYSQFMFLKRGEREKNEKSDILHEYARKEMQTLKKNTVGIMSWRPLKTEKSLSPPSVSSLTPKQSFRDRVQDKM